MHHERRGKLAKQRGHKLKMPEEVIIMMGDGYTIIKNLLLKIQALIFNRAAENFLPNHVESPVL